jgi:hypothetical protein
MTAVKTCKGCGEALPLSAYSSHKDAAGGV